MACSLQHGAQQVIPWSAGGPSCYQTLQVIPNNRETVVQLVCLGLCLSVCVLTAAAGGLHATLQKHVVAATAPSQLFCRLGTAKVGVWTVAWYHKN